MDHVKIRLNRHAAGTTIAINGKKLRGVTRVEVIRTMSDRPVVKLSLVAEVEIDGEAEVETEEAAA